MVKQAERNIDIDRLCGAMQRSRLVMERARRNRFEMIRQYVGPYWSEDGTPEKRPVNLLSLYVNIISRNLVAKNPRVLLSTFDRKQKPAVEAMQAWGNKEIERMRLENTLRRWVVDALFSIGIMKVALADPARAASVSWNLAAGQAFAQCVDLDDWVYDTKANDFAEAGYMAHRYRVPLDTIKDSSLYSKARKELSASPSRIYNEQGDQRVGTLGRGQYAGLDEEFEDMIDLWEVYVPRHRAILTLADDNLWTAGTIDGEALREQNWVGPDTGPYHTLGFGVVPGNAMPKAPMQDLLDLDEAANRAYRKVIRMSERTKEVTFFQGSAEDAERYKNANDGDLLAVSRPDSIKQNVSSGAAVQQILAVATVLKDLFSFMGGNLELMGGRGPQSKTAKQDTLLNENAGVGMADMQDRTVQGASQVLRALCWYWWKDPFHVQRSKHSVNGVAEIQREVTPAMRAQGKFEDLDIEVDPYSMQHATPQSRMAALDQTVQQIVIPMTQLLQAQGIVFDMNRYLQKKAQYMDMPDLSEIITIQDPPEQGLGGGSEQPKMPGQTERTYNRVSMPGRTEQGNNKNLVNSLLGVDGGGASRNGGANGAPM